MDSIIRILSLIQSTIVNDFISLRTNSPSSGTLETQYQKTGKTCRQVQSSPYRIKENSVVRLIGSSNMIQNQNIILCIWFLCGFVTTLSQISGRVEYSNMFNPVTYVCACSKQGSFNPVEVVVFMIKQNMLYFVFSSGRQLLHLNIIVFSIFGSFLDK